MQLDNLKLKLIELKEKYSPLLLPIKEKIDQNKKVFWLLVTLFGIMFLIIVVGLIYRGLGSRDSDLTIKKPEPTQQGSYVNTGGKIYDDLTLDEDRLHIINDSLINYDPYQRKLTPIDLTIETEL